MIYSSCDTECDRLKLIIMAHFLPFYPPLKSKKNQNFEKMKKNCWRYHHFTQVYQKPQSYEVQFLRYGVRQTEFFVILGHFLPLYPLNNWENQNFTTMEKASWDVITLHMCTKNHNHMMYASHNFLSFWTILDPKNKNLE